MTRGERPAISWRPGRPTGRWRCCRTGSSPTSFMIRRCRPRWTSAWLTRRCLRAFRTGCWPWRRTCCCGVTGFAAVEYLDLLERSQPAIPPDSRLAARLAAMRSLRCALTGEADEAVRYGLAARGIEERTLPGDEWDTAVPLILLRAYTWLEDFEAVDREAAAALAMPSLAEPARLVRCARGAGACLVRSRPHRRRPRRPPGPLTRTRGGWDSNSTPSPWITCASWRGRAGAAGSRRGGASHRACAVDI